MGRRATAGGPSGGAGGRGGTRGERGYALVALLALMSLLVIGAMAAAPSLRQQQRRALELEAIARGEEVADAIRAYVHYANRLPTSMDELIEGAPFGTKKVQVLRASAARDPLSSSGEWRLVKVNDPAFSAFVSDLYVYCGSCQPQSLIRDNRMRAAAGNLTIQTVLGTGGEREDPPGGEDQSLSSSGPFVGVASRSRRESVVAYYGVERHDRWVFTPLFR